jgi:hypothetical protein
MKRLLLLLPLFLSMAILTVAQNCIPDGTITEPGVYPEQPDTAYVDVAYDFSFQILAIKDTIVIFAGQTLTANIDSVRVDDVIGLPSNFNYTCEPNSCTFNWKAVGCINVKGNPTNNQAGVYDLKIATTAFASLGITKIPTLDTAKGYQLVIKGDGSASIFEPKKDIVAIYPNPSGDGIFQLTAKEEPRSIRITDLQGKKIVFEGFSSNGITTIDISNTAKGVYLLNLKVGEHFYNKKIVH